LYGVLGLDNSASFDEIRRAYRRAALHCHPDKVPASERVFAEHQFKKVAHAYEILSDPDKRSFYDERGDTEDFFHPAQHEEEFQFHYQSANSGSYNYSNFRFAFGKPPRTRDAHLDLAVSLEDLYRGRTFKLASCRLVLCKRCKGRGTNSSRQKAHKCMACNGLGHRDAYTHIASGVIAHTYVSCGVCNGEGHIYDSEQRCKRCRGEKTVKERSVLEVYVWPGAAYGDEIRIAGMSDEQLGCETGDIILTLQPKEIQSDNARRLTRKGSNLYTTVRIGLGEALLGVNRVVLTHLDGRLLRMNTAGKTVSSGQIMVIKGEGMPVPGTTDFGDLFLSMEVVIPGEEWIQD
ncbi:hypothetical protein CANCADRAFT_11624, partial [Tortispora caseinolytica NRRL Y-17796]